MADSTCKTCHNLEYGRFEKLGICQNINVSRYLAIEFATLGETARAGCILCTIIDRGTKLFWGDWPEEWDDSNVSDKSSSSLSDENILVLERRPGMSLIAFRHRRACWRMSPSETHLQIEFFTEISRPSQPFSSNAG